MTNQAYAQPQVTLDRIISAMQTFDIELTKVEGRDDAATANLNGLPCLFAVLDSVAIVRCDVPTDAVYTQADAGLFLAANQINSVAFGARAVISEHENLLVVRTERDIPCAAGLSDEQLTAASSALRMPWLPPPRRWPSSVPKPQPRLARLAQPANSAPLTPRNTSRKRAL